MLLETRSIVCEGKCNDDLHDYDAACHRQAQFGDIKDYLRIRVKSLVHTTHVVARETYYDISMGWTRQWQCSVCGHRRRF